ncbi:MAG TPA: hypothetical protein PLO61_04990 [Fimbriimonadaceae bacterium]|nr:hypothetical protein [Fimbriimonadaceae bacterium]HRJ32574.1 hypothetical protein [Fimbriimonadaceae bacterium]
MGDRPIWLPKDDRPLRSIFLDLNAYFASVEQQEDPSLRGKPVAVVPLLADTTFVIAASYEAKAYGIKTGTRVDEAKARCPDLILRTGRAPLYSHYHRRVLDAVDTVLPVEKVCSIDEMRFRLMGKEQQPEVARQLAQRLKSAITELAGDWLKCSIGIAPNPFLAKLATDLMKPDGLVVIEGHELPDRLRGLSLREFCGINRRMEARLHGAGIFTSDDLVAASPEGLRRAFGSVVGERWYYLLRGYDLEETPTHRRSLGNSHVLPPNFRTDQGARQVLLRLTQKAAARLRAEGLYAGSIHLSVKGTKKSWKASQKLPNTQDSVRITQAVTELWEDRNFVGPLAVGLAFADLSETSGHTPSLFEAEQDTTLVSDALDRVNQKFGKNKVFLASLQGAKDTAEERIAFQKTKLFQEGKDDNLWE